MWEVMRENLNFRLLVAVTLVRTFSLVKMDLSTFMTTRYAQSTGVMASATGNWWEVVEGPSGVGPDSRGP